MATFIEGRRGSGKSKWAVAKIQLYLNEGRKVVTNLDLFLENLVPDNKYINYIRLPDYPRSEDLHAIGMAYDTLDENNPDSYDENKNGVVVIDELLTSFNSRNWNDPDRLNVINWIVLSRKKGWDLYFIGQDFGSIDKQIQDTVIEEIISCRSNEKLYPGVFWNFIIKPFYMRLAGKKHFAYRYDGKSKGKDTFNYRESFKREDLHICYKTGQIFKKKVRLIHNEGAKKPIEFDDRALFSVIGKHYFKSLKSYPMVIYKPEDSLFTKLKKRFFSSLKKPLLINFALVGLSVVFAYLYFTKPQNVTKNIVKVENVKPVVKKEFKSLSDVKDKLIDSDIGLIYIDCFQSSTDGRFDYCFKNKEGDIVRPEYIGYKVLSNGECHVKLVRHEVVLDVYCDPVIRKQEPINTNDESLVTAV
jgi:hypothetical protein